MHLHNAGDVPHADIDVAAVRYDVDFPAALFDPMQLPNALRSPVWQGLGGI